MIAIIASNDKMRNEPTLTAIKDVCEVIGHKTKVYIPAEYPRFKGNPPADAFVWNGGKGIRGDITARLRSEGIRVFIIERGFFDRENYIQIDHKGFNHTASWAGKAVNSCYHGIQDGEKRLAKLLGREPLPVKRRDHGHILVLCQVDGDEQLSECEIHHANALVDLVSGEDVVVRPHPLGKRYLTRHAKLSTNTLEEDVAGARFCVTINSNAGNDAISYGCPVLCFGPALYATAHVAKRTSVATIGQDMDDMLTGWQPVRDSRLYLELLVSRQWNEEELRNGNIVKDLLEGKL